MKVGDTVPVQIAGQQVALATVKEIDTTVDPWTARLVVPGTVVVMAMRAQLAPEVTPDDDPATRVVLTDAVEPAAQVPAPNLATTQTPGGEAAAQAPAPVATPTQDAANTVSADGPVEVTPAVEAAVEERATE